MRYAITAERKYGVQIYRLRVFAWDNSLLLDITRWSEQGAKIALMQYEQRTGRK
jgi:hypothetical protein